MNYVNPLGPELSPARSGHPLSPEPCLRVGLGWGFANPTVTPPDASVNNTYCLT